MTWVACEYPERGPDPFVVWHVQGCRACLIKIQVQERRFPDDSHVLFLAGMIRCGMPVEESA